MGQFKVQVKSSGGKVDVKVDPKPVPTSPEYLEEVSTTMSGIILRFSDNTVINRISLKRSLISALNDFEKRGMIAPKE